MNRSSSSEQTLIGNGLEPVTAPTDGNLCCQYGDENDLKCAETILLVEDEAFVREVTGEVLQSAGYRVLTARNAAEAARIYDERGAEVDLLLTDVILPRESGYDLAARVRKRNPVLKVLYVTGYAEHMQVVRGQRGDCLAKPFSGADLLNRVRLALDQREWPAPMADDLALPDRLRVACRI